MIRSELICLLVTESTDIDARYLLDFSMPIQSHDYVWIDRPRSESPHENSMIFGVE